MFDLDNWREIYHALASNKLRTFLTAFGVFWGIFLLMVMLGSGNGLENGVSIDFGDGVTNCFFLWTQTTSKPHAGLPKGRRFEMNNEDAIAVREQIHDADIICPRNQLGGFRDTNNVVRKDKSGGFNVMGDYPEIRRMEGLRIDRGRFLNPLDLEDKRKVAVIGRRVAEVLFEKDEDPIGDHIRISGVYFKIVGIHSTLEGGDDGDENAQTIYVPFTTFQKAFNYGNQVGWFAIAPREGVPASVVEEQTIALMKQRHRVAPDDDRAFGHFNLEERYNQVMGLFTGIRTLVWIVGIGTLAAGVIGVSNIMLVIVRERTHEIGIRRALGATPLMVVGQIILEAIILTAAAGYLGLVGGMGLMDFIASMMAQAGANSDSFADPVVQLGAAMQALLVLMVAGVLAGLIPAQRAVSISPVDALRAD